METHLDPTAACSTVIELLPWLLNGTLEAAEEGEVRRHLEACADCRLELAETREAFAVFSAHPTAGEVAAFAMGDDVPTVDRHAGFCPSCREEVRLATSDRVVAFPGVRTSPSWRPAARRAAIAAGIALAVASATLLGTLLAGGGRLPDRAAEVAPPPAPAPAAPTLFTDGFEGGLQWSTVVGQRTDT